MEFLRRTRNEMFFPFNNNSNVSKKLPTAKKHKNGKRKNCIRFDNSQKKFPFRGLKGIREKALFINNIVIRGDKMRKTFAGKLFVINSF